VLSLRLLANTVEEERSQGCTTEPETLRLPPGELDRLADRFLLSLPSGVAERRIVRLARTPRFDVEALAAICSPDRDQRAEEVRHILGYSFVQPTDLTGWYSLHPRMREAILQLPKFNTQTDAKVHHQEWASYWRSRSQDLCDDFAGLAWFHDWQNDREAAFNHWQAFASQARGELRTRDHQRVLEWIELTGIETDRDLNKFEAGMLRAFAGELVQDALGHPRGQLIRAVAACQRALTVFDRDREAQDWAMTQINLGNALRNLGMCSEGEAGRRYLEEAVAAFRAALEVYTREALP
jgi:hypothetical protein